MSIVKLSLVIGVATLAASTVADAHVIHLHHSTARHRRLDVPLGATRNVSAADAGWSASSAIIEQATRRSQRDAGLVSELDPSAKETATGGPSGGLPTFGGGGN